MTKPRIAAIVAAATLGAAAFTGAAVALAADKTPSPSASESAPSRDMDGQSSRQDGPGGHGPREGHGPGDRGRGGPGEHGPGAHGPGQRGPGGEMVHSEGVIEDADGTFVTVRMQEGDVTAVSATSITVKSADGYTSTYALNDETIVERDGEDTAPKVGDIVHVRGTVTGGTTTADMVHALSPEKAKELEEHRAAMEDWMSERPEGAGRA